MTSKIRLKINGQFEQKLLLKYKTAYEEECSENNTKIKPETRELIKKYPIWKIYTDTRYENSLVRVLYVNEIKCKDECNPFLSVVYLTDNSTVEEVLIPQKNSHYIVDILSLSPEQLNSAQQFLYPDAFSHTLGFIFLLEGGEDIIHEYIKKEYE